MALHSHSALCRHTRPASVLLSGSRRAPVGRRVAPNRAAAAQVVQCNAESDMDPSDLARAEVTRRIRQLARDGKPREAVAELAQMARMGIQPDTQAATALVSAWAQSNKMDMAQSVFDELFSSYVAPDDVAFAVMVRGYGASDPPAWGSIRTLLSRMESEFQVPVSVRVYNSLLDICARTRDFERGEELIERMHASGIIPDEYTLKAVESRRTLRAHLKRTYGKDVVREMC